MKRLLAKSILLAGGMSLSSHILALGLGEMELDSALNQPLSAEIKLIDTQGLTSSEIKPKLASAADFERAGIDRYQFLTQMKFSVNGDRLLITTRDPVNEPFLNFLVELNWPAGRVLREYTVLLDPPVFEEGRVQPLVAVPAGSVQSQATATAPEARPQPTPAPKRSNNWQTPAAPGTYKVQPNDTLWEIALATRPDASVTPQQMMIALQDVNPGAFINGNINRLKTHTVLDIPDASIIETVNNREAVAEVVRQNRELKAGVAQIDATGRNTDTSGPRKSTGNGEVRLLASEATGDSNQSGGSVAGKAGTAGAAETDLAIALENLDKSQRENQELVERLNALEEQLAKMERLITLQNDQLASMQAGTESAPEAAAPIADSNAAVTGEEPNADVPDESPAEPAAQTEEAEAGAPVAEQEAVSDEEATATEDATPESETGAVAEGTDYNYSEGAAAESEQAAPVQTAEQKAMTERAAAEARRSAAESDKSIADKIMAIPYPYFAIAAGLLLTLVYAIMKLKARKEEDAVAEAEAELNAAEAAAMAPDNTELDLPDNSDLPDFDDNLSSESNDAGFGNFDLGDEELDSNIESDLSDIDLDAYEDADGEYETVGQTEDAISESDIYIAYGKFDQAIELLKGAIAAEPERTDLRLKQLEVLSSLDDAEAFAEAEANLIAIGDTAANAEAAEFRQQLSNPIEPEIRADEADALSLDGELPSIDESAEDEFEGGMDFGAALDFGDDATPEDDGIGAQLEEVPDLKLDESSDFDAEKEGVDMSLEDDVPELDDDLLNFDMGDDDELSAAAPSELAEDELAAETDDLASLDDAGELPSFDIESGDDLSADLEDITAELPAESSSAIDFSVDDFDLDPDELVDSAESVKGPADSPVSGELADADNDLSLDFEVDEASPSKTNEALDDLLDLDEEPEADLDSHLAADLADSADESDDDLPELTFDTEESAEVEVSDSTQDGVVEETSTEDVADENSEATELAESSDEKAGSVDEDAFVATSDEDDLSDDSVSEDLEALMSSDDDLAAGSDLIGGIDLDELAAADDEFDFLAGTDECATKLDLARAYVDMEDVDGAKELLQEVVQEGNDAQKQEAKDLMDKLA